MNKPMNKVIKSHVILAILTVFSVVLLAGGLTYSLFYLENPNTTNQKIALGNLSANLSSVSGKIVLNDLVPESATDITDEDLKYTFTVTNDGDYPIDFEVYLTDETVAFLTDAANASYTSYKQLSQEHYKYINYKLDGKEAFSNIASMETENKTVILKGSLKPGEHEDHYLQFWLDASAPNDIAGSIVSLDIHMTAGVSGAARTELEKKLENLGLEVKEDEGLDFSQTAPAIVSYTDDNFNGSTSNTMMSTTYRGYNYTYADDYTFNESTGTYTLTNPQVCKYSECYTTLVNKYIVSYSGSTSSSVASSTNRSIIYKVTSETTLDKLYYISSSKTANYDYSKDGLYAMEDDYGTSYYFRGAPENNYVKFGQNSSGQDMYWRIIRFNGDGSIRMIYDGTSAHANGERSTERLVMTNKKWNADNNDAKYVGYMFGGTQGEASTSKEQAQTNETPSEIKTTLEAWYKTNIADTGYGSYIADTIFCNDRSIADSSQLGYGANRTYYGAYTRVYSNKKPSFVCSQDNDKFTVSSENGNGKLEYPVGLITADEILAGGSGVSKTNTGYYLYKGSWYWSFSPNYFSGSDANVFNESGRLNGYYVNSSGAVAPVINLKAEYLNQLKGTGTASDPYRLS